MWCVSRCVFSTNSTYLRHHQCEYHQRGWFWWYLFCIPQKNYPLLKKLRVGKQFGFLTSALTHRFSAYFVNFILGFICQQKRHSASWTYEHFLAHTVVLASGTSIVGAVAFFFIYTWHRQHQEQKRITRRSTPFALLEVIFIWSKREISTMDVIYWYVGL